MRLYQAFAMLTLAMPLAACGPSATQSVSGLSGVLGNQLLSARGATRDDQRKIDGTIEAGVRAGVWDRRDAPAAQAGAKIGAKAFAGS